MNARRDRREAPLAWAVVASIHLFCAWWALRPTREVVRDEAPMLLVFVSLRSVQSGAPNALPSPVLPNPSATPDRAQRVRSRDANEPPARAQASTVAPAEKTEAPRLILRPAEDGLRFRQDALADRRGSIERPPPERFRMRETASIAGAVRGVAQTLFWPPGYSDNPCSGLPEAVEKFSGARTARERELLADAVRERSRYCRR